MRRVVVPPHPGTLCALGCLVSDLKSDFIQTVNLEIDPGDPDQCSDRLSRSLARLKDQATTWLADENVSLISTRVRFSADMRFAGQAFEIEVSLGDLNLADPALGRNTLNAFYDRYHALYSVGDLPGSIEVVNVRATAIGTMPRPATGRKSGRRLTGVRSKPVPVGWHTVYVDGQSHRTAVYKRDQLAWGHTFDGPAVVHQYDSTIFLPPRAKATVDAFGTLIGEVVI